MIRTHNAGTLRAEHAGQTVTLAGWVARRRDHGGVIFIDLRDASGVAQVVFREGEMAERAHGLRGEYCVKVTGEVVRRPEGNENPELPTGEIEVTVTELEVLSESAPLPFPIDEHVESARRRGSHRYLDLRRSGPAAAMRLRSEANRIARDGAARARLRRGRDPDPDPLHPRGRPRLPGPGPAAARHLVRPAAVPAAVQAAADGGRRWSGTTRSPAATATRTSAPTGSRSSPSSTSR